MKHKIVVGTSLLLLVMLLGTAKIHYIVDGSGGEVLGNGERAIVFIDVYRSGYVMSYLSYPWVRLKEYFHAVPYPTSRKISVVVIQTTPQSMDRKVLDVAGNQSGIEPNLYTPLGDQVYALCQGVLCRWDNSEFVPASVEEQAKFGGINRLIPPGDQDINGWTKRAFGQSANDYQFTISLGSEASLLIKNGVIDKDQFDSASIDLLRKGQPPQRIWNLDGHPRRVGKSEYDRAFSSR